MTVYRKQGMGPGNVDGHKFGRDCLERAFELAAGETRLDLNVRAEGVVLL